MGKRRIRKPRALGVESIGVDVCENRRRKRGAVSLLTNDFYDACRVLEAVYETERLSIA